MSEAMRPDDGRGQANDEFRPKAQPARHCEQDDRKARERREKCDLDGPEKVLVLKRREEDEIDEESRQAGPGSVFQGAADQEEKRLAEAGGVAEKSLERAREGHGQIEKEISVLKERIGSLKDKTEEREKELTQSEESLNDRI